MKMDKQLYVMELIRLYRELGYDMKSLVEGCELNANFIEDILEERIDLTETECDNIQEKIFKQNPELRPVATRRFGGYPIRKMDKIYPKEGPAVFFTSDLHFGHENVLAFDNRPFSSVEKMNEELIARWNAKVRPGDIVYVLGDMIWKTEHCTAAELIKKLNGTKILIKGNHDRFLHNADAKKCFAAIKDYEDIHVKLIDGTDRRVIMSHYFIPFYNGHLYNAIHLHGHSHVTDEAFFEERMIKDFHKDGIRHESYNVGCMYWDYEPVTLDEILFGR